MGITNSHGSTGKDIGGEMVVDFLIGDTTFKHRVLVADVEETVILGMDVMTKLGFQLDLKGRVLRIGNEEIVLRGRQDTLAFAILTEDTVIPGHSEAITHAELDRPVSEGIMMIEPTKDPEKERKFLIATALVQPAPKYSNA